MQATTQQTIANNTSAFAAVMNAGGHSILADVFRPKVKETATETQPQTNLPSSVKSALDEANALVANYSKLKVEVLDRSDRALWEMLEGVYGYVRQIEKTPTKRQTRTELIKQIQIRDKQGMASNCSIEAVVVRYVFADQSRQSRNNYTIAMEKAAALEIPVNAFADFLAEHGGVCKVVEKTFDHEQQHQANAKDLAEAKKGEKVQRAKLVDRLFSAMAHNTEALLDYNGVVSNWVPEKPKAKVDSKAKTTDKVEPKYEAGNFVFFVTVKNPETGKFHVVQGNMFNKAYELQLLSSIADFMDVNTNELNTAVHQLENSIGFEDLNDDSQTDAE